MSSGYMIIMRCLVLAHLMYYLLSNKANGQALDVYIDSGGGDIFAGSIYEALRSYTGQVNIHIQVSSRQQA